MKKPFTIDDALDFIYEQTNELFEKSETPASAEHVALWEKLDGTKMVLLNMKSVLWSIENTASLAKGLK
jgi:hypothetical protein